MPIAVRIVPNMSPPLDEQTSIENVGRMPCASSRPVAGQPWPICISTSGATDAVPPDSAIRSSSSSPSVLQWT